MRGILAHFFLTLRLNLKSPQALIYGYLVPIFFLIAFGAIFRSANPPLVRQLGQLLTISILGGACFGMPTGMVAERERGIWRRYRLLPVATSSLVISTMAARFVIVLSAAVLQILLARLMYGMPLPAHPVQLFLAFTAVAFAFLGMGLIIAMLANTVPAVQALGQAIFLPMIIIGGVGVPLYALPMWARHVAGFLPGIYAVHALDDARANALGAAGFDILALLIIGTAACVAGSRMFRWDAHEKPDPRHRLWILLALVAWLSVGIAAEIRQQRVHAISYDNLPDDDGVTAPVATDFSDQSAEDLARIAELRRLLAAWPPGAVSSATDRVRNLLNAAAIADVAKDRYEAQFAALVFEKLTDDLPPETLEEILASIILHPDAGKPLAALPAEFQIDEIATPEDIPERIRIYAIKLLGRLNGKRPPLK